ncbi:MAG: hypothetical protein H9W80_12560 [Enterococcus sp.]|nr:hypothetical protein [Enterococcus sp.]
MKKIIAILTIIMVFILPFSVTFNEQKAHANIISKPLTITAKKVAKELAQESAVAMAEHILFEKAINEFINSDVHDGYKPVCLDGPVNKVEDCAPNKVVQVKENLSGSDRTALSNKVEQVLEQKTNTSSKWTKFLDWFIPIFLVSGLVATFESMMDGDSESLIDEIALQALKEANLIKSLQPPLTESKIDFSEIVRSVDVIYSETNLYTSYADINLVIAPNTTFSLNFTANNKQNTLDIKNAARFRLAVNKQGAGDGYGNYVPRIRLADFYNGSTRYSLPYFYTIHQGSTMMKFDPSMVEAERYFVDYFLNDLKTTDVNHVMNKFISYINGAGANATHNVTTTVKPPIVEPDYSGQKAVEMIKNPNGTVTTPGIENFTYTYNNTYIYPSPTSNTGWKDKATDIDIAVVEDDVVVDGGEPPIDPEAPPAEDDDINTDKDKDKIKKKSRDWSALLTTRFPFSLPWDFLHLMKFLYAEPMTPHWEIEGTEKIPFNLKIDLKFMEPYAPWFRTFIFLSFVMSVIFLHGRFMGGSK